MDDLYRSTMQFQMATVVTNTTEILNRIRFVDPDTLQAQQFVEGRNVRANAIPEVLLPQLSDRGD